MADCTRMAALLHIAALAIVSLLSGCSGFHFGRQEVCKGDLHLF